jgi:hypothetical protein
LSPPYWTELQADPLIFFSIDVWWNLQLLRSCFLLVRFHSFVSSLFYSLFCNCSRLLSRKGDNTSAPIKFNRKHCNIN